MKKILLQEITLQNFKGIRDAKFQLTEKVTKIGGKNGSGKTSIFDAFVWCLFGKNSEDRKQFAIETLNADGKIIEGLTHSVSISLKVDDECYNITRTQKDKWSKGEFKGGTQTRTINGEDKSVADFNLFVAQICSEQTFKSITSPYFFTAQKWQDQRAFLMSLVSDVKIDNSIIRNLTDRLKYLNNQISDTKAVIKSKQDELNKYKDIPFDTIGQAIVAKKQALNNIDDTKRIELGKQIAIEMEKQIAEVNKQNAEMLNKKSEAEREVLNFQTQVLDLTRIVQKLNETSKRTTSEIEFLRNEYRVEFAKKMEFNNSDFVCPTCGRPFELENIEQKKAEMTANFNQNKAEKLKQLNADGQRHATILKDIAAQLQETESKLEDAKKSLEDAKSAPILSENVSTRYAKSIEDSEEVKKLKSELANIPDFSEQKNILINEISELSSKMAFQKVAANLDNEIAALKEQLKKDQANAITIEGGIQKAKEDQADAIRNVETKINSKFNLVRFKLFDKLVNGEETECCIATYNGVPYSDLNNAAKINIGLDIVNTICEMKQVQAPIFIDNAESVNNIEETESQQIRLYVTDTELTIINNK